MRSSRKLDAGIVLVLFLLPLLWFAPQALGGKTLLPADNLFANQPWAAFASQLGVGVPHNPLISDLILENYAWKSFLRDALRSGQLPLWSPRLFAGTPFLAAGQHSALYPLSILFYVLPLWRAYGVFTWFQLGIAAACMYLFARLLGQRPPAATLAAVVFAFSGFFIASVNFTMIIAAAAWLPLILAAIEMTIRKCEGGNGRMGEWGSGGMGEGEKGISPTLPLSHSPIPYVVGGAALFGIQTYAGHVEITYYVLMVSAFYAVWRLAGTWLRSRLASGTRAGGAILRSVGWLLAMVVAGLCLGAVQLIPMYELVSQNFRQGSTSLQQVVGWAWPKKQIITFLLPDFFGNPTHHSYFDLWRRAWIPVTNNALGEPLKAINGGAIDWGVKNWVEGANYVGIASLLLAVAAVWGLIRQALACARPGGQERTGDVRPAPDAGPWPVLLRHWPLLGFAVLTVLALLFAFGTPLYAVLYYLVPGYNQLHSAFRWVYPYTLSVALVAGFGLNMLLDREMRASIARPVRVLGLVAVVAGLGSLLLVALSLVVPGPFIGLGDRLLAASDLARQRGFANGAMAWSYEAMGLLRFGVVAALAGLVLLWSTRGESIQTPRRLSWPTWSIALVVLLVADLWLMGHDFNPATDPKLLAFKPPIMEWLQSKIDTAQPWRFTTFDAPGDKLVNSNTAMPYGLEDVRGYDSMIPQQYVAYMQRIQTQGELLYNRIAPLYGPGNDQQSDVLDNRLLDLLGVRYVVTTQKVSNQGYQLAYPADHEPASGELRAYENTGALPRVFIVPKAVAAPDESTALDTLQKADPAKVVVVEGIDQGSLPSASSPQVREARISDYGLRQVLVDVNVSDRGWLVFTDNYFEGWKAYVRPFGSQGEGVDASGNAVEQQVPLYRADGTFRAVYLDHAGQWTVRFVYSPRSLVLGGYLTFLAAIILLLLAGLWAWGRFYRGARSEIGTAAKNSAVQVVMSLLNRVIDFAFTMLRLRILGPVGEGSYVNAINFYLIFEILTRFGLGTLVTRDVARDRSQAWRYLVNVTVLRLGLWLVSLPLIFLTALGYRLVGQLTGAEAQAITIFAIALLFANVADAISSVFNAFEKMEYPAGLATAVTVGKVALGALVLLPPFSMGFVGLTAVSLIMNVVQVVWLYVLLEQKVLPREGMGVGEWGRGSVGARAEQAERFSQSTAPATPFSHSPTLPFSHSHVLDWPLQREMFRESGPLMINNLLATVFWRLSQFVLRGATTAAALGIFSVGVKFLDGLNVIPSYFTLAIFPLMSRYAQAGTSSLAKAYRLAVQLLLITALPVAIFATFAATPLVSIVGGSAFLPDSATALSIMIWSIPIGFVNSVTQYVLIAVNQQRFLTKAFIVGVAFTTLANVTLVPRLGYLAAAAILIPAELSLFIPFTWAVHRYVAPMPWGQMCAGPILAAVLDAAIIWMGNRIGVPLVVSLGVGFLAYVVTLALIGTFKSDDFAVLRSRLPQVRLPLWRRA